MGNFFERRLGAEQPLPRGIVVPPQQPQVVVPPGYQLVPVQPQPQPQQVQVPPGYQLVPTQGHQVQTVQSAPVNTKMNYLEFARQHDGEKISHYWKGGDAHRLEGNLACPQCGSPTGYTNYSSTMMHGTRPRPHCFECGYNGLFQQADQANWSAA